jgi:hypothetical protein
MKSGHSFCELDTALRDAAGAGAKALSPFAMGRCDRSLAQTEGAGVEILIGSLCPFDGSAADRRVDSASLLIFKHPTILHLNRLWLGEECFGIGAGIFPGDAP